MFPELLKGAIPMMKKLLKKFCKKELDDKVQGAPFPSRF